METDTCEKCGAATVVPGQLRTPGDLDGMTFVPAGTTRGFGVRAVFRACLSCGHVWTSVMPEALRDSIRKHGHALARQYLIRCEKGPYYDLPDIPEARRAADGVAEIDLLMLEGNNVEAVRRYRQLTGQIWDDVHEAMRQWAELSRERKLALFGWSTKQKPEDEPANLRDHPMRDRVLDG